MSEPNNREVIAGFNEAYARAQAAREPLCAHAVLSWVEAGRPRSCSVRLVSVDEAGWRFEAGHPELGVIRGKPVAVCFFWESIKVQVCIEGDADADADGAEITAAPRRVEFWSNRAFRLHERIVYELLNNVWKRTKLYP